MAFILLVDDQASLLELLAQAVHDNGHRVLTAAEGTEALRLATGRLDTIDLLVSDIQMPRMSGIELCRRLRQRRPELKVLFISGCTEHDELAQPLLKKPFNTRTFLRAVGKMLTSA